MNEAASMTTHEQVRNTSKELEVITNFKQKSKSTAKLKEELWRACSLYIRKRDKVCKLHEILHSKNIAAPCNCAGVLQACHKYSRKYNAIKYDERNLFAGCAGSNAWAHYNPEEWYMLWRELWKDDVEYLDRSRNARVKRTRGDFALMTLDFQQRTERLK